MTRVRTDNVFGTLTNNPLLIGGTTMNSAGLANLAAVSSAEALIVLDPNRVAGAPEIVVVTAHTGAATSATIVRGQFGTVARQHLLGTEWVHGPIAANATTFVTAADDQGDYVPMNAWETYTPSNTNVTVGNGTQSAAFMRNGRTIYMRYQLLWGSTTSFGGTIEIGAPVPGVAGRLQVLSALSIDTGTREFPGVYILGDATTSVGKVAHAEAGSAGQVNATNPMTWVTGDQLVITGSYEAAS